MPCTERVDFRILVTPCCGTMLCWVNPRLPNHCPECGKGVWPAIRGCVTYHDNNAVLKHKGTG